MSHDLLIAAVTSRKSRIYPDDLTAAYAAMAALDDIELFSLAGGEDDIEVLLEQAAYNERWYDDDEELTLTAWRDAGAVILSRLSEDLDDTAVLRVAGCYVFVAGGESSSDSPSRAVGQIPGDDYADAITLTDGPALSAVFWTRDPAGEINQLPIGQI